MRSKSPNLSLSLPTCGKCGRYWRPARGVVSDVAYCKKCSKERQAVAARQLGHERITAEHLTKGFLLPRRLRAV